MTWFKVGDELTFHPRVLRAGNAAIGLWVRAGTWCSEHLTEGWISAEDARALGSVTEIKKLVSVGLWYTEERDGTAGYQFHRWATNGVGDKRQPTRADVEAERERNRQRQQKFRDRKKGEGEEPPPVSSGNGGSNGDVTRYETRDTTVSNATPVPSRPDLPDPSDQVAGASARPTTRPARQIPADFRITEPMREWAAEKVPNLDIDRSTLEFETYWRGAGKAMKDWEQVWRNGMLKADARGDHRRAAAPPRTTTADRYAGRWS